MARADQGLKEYCGKEREKTISQQRKLPHSTQLDYKFIFDTG